MFDLWVYDIGVDKGYDCLPRNKGGQFIIGILICFLNQLTDDIVTPSREPERFQLAAVVEIVDHRPRIEYLRTSETVAVVPVTYFIIFFRNAIVFSHLSNFIWSKAEVRAVLAVEDRIDRDII